MVLLAPLSTKEHSRIPRIEILGVFGSGKSTFAKKLASASALQLLPEDHSKNLFWGRVEVIERAGHLPYDLSFLVQHAYLAASGLAGGAVAGICDWSFATDRLWASMRLDDEGNVYDTVHSTVLNRLGKARGFLYLRQPVDLIVERIGTRGRPSEAGFHKFVLKAARAVDLLAQQIPHDQLLVVDDDDIDLALAKIENWLLKEPW